MSPIRPPSYWILLFVLGGLLLFGGAALAGELITAELEGVINEVNVYPGGGIPFNITLKAGGALNCSITEGNPARAQVETLYFITTAGDGTLRVLPQGQVSAPVNFFAGPQLIGSNRCEVAGGPYLVPALVHVDPAIPPGTTFTIDLVPTNGTTRLSNPAGLLPHLEDLRPTTLTFRVGAPPNPCHNCNRAPSLSAGPEASGDEGSTIPLNGEAVDPDGDSMTVKWSVTPAAGVDPGATCNFANPDVLATTISCTDDGEYLLKLTVLDSRAATVSATTRLLVRNVAPLILTLPVSGDLFAINTTVAISPTYSDVGLNDQHTFQIDWGNGATTDGVASGGTFHSTYAYPAAGVYTLNVRVLDDDGGLVSQEFRYMVVFDPSAGYVSGNGCIESPPGAYRPDPSLTGSAAFAFVSRYQSGATVPSGKTQFRFDTGGLNFVSTNHQWLVVSGPKAQFKGWGTINNRGDYGFLLTLNDGQISGGGGDDRFRIKIWDRASGALVYDNQLGDSEDANATQIISCGKIVIHRNK